MDDQLTTDRPRDRRFALTFTGLLLAMLLAALDQTIVSTALPAIVRDLGGIEDLSWVVTAYLLTATVSTPLWGRISDLYGRKRLFQGAIAIFLAGSALSGMAQDIGELIAFRGLQGLGAGGLMTLAMAIVADIVAPRERGRYQGYIQMTFAVASIAGPLLGGLFTDHASWRWAFYVNIPIGLAALTVITTQLQLPAVDRGRPRIDYLGGALLGGAISSVLLVTVWGGRQYAWDSVEILGLIGAAVVLLGAFVAQERRAPEPILPLRLFAEPVFAVVSVTLFLTGCAFFAAIVFMPVFLQLATGASATSSGLLLLPMLLSAMAATTLSGRAIARTGRYKAFPVAGLGLMAAGLLGMSTMDAGISYADGLGVHGRVRHGLRARHAGAGARGAERRRPQRHRDRHRLDEPVPRARRLGRRRAVRLDPHRRPRRAGRPLARRRGRRAAPGVPDRRGDRGARAGRRGRAAGGSPEDQARRMTAG